MEFVLVAATAIVIIGVVVAAYEVYERHSQGANATPRSFLLFFLGMLASGFLANGLLFFFAADFVCSGNAGAGCAFGLAVLTQPFFWAIGATVFLFLWARGGRSAR